MGQNRKSQAAFPMSVKPPKAEVARRRFHFRYVPLPEVAMLVEEPSTAQETDNRLSVVATVKSKRIL